jgi:hypothetical protein
LESLGDNLLLAIPSSSLSLDSGSWIPQVLEDIMNFKLDSTELVHLCDIPVGKDSRYASNGLSSPEILTYNNNSITTETIGYQKLAISQVEELLERLDQCERFMPPWTFEVHHRPVNFRNVMNT